MTYLDGTLELVSPSHAHEQIKKVIGGLLEASAEEQGVDLWAFGSATFRSEAARGGLEPDECYTFQRGEPEPGRPDLAIEVVVSRPLADELEVYRRLDVPEVWVWRDGALTVYGLEGAGYAPRERSAFLPSLDLALLARFVRVGESLTRLKREFRAAQRG